jgi:hypothetical protein
MPTPFSVCQNEEWVERGNLIFVIFGGTFLKQDKAGEKTRAADASFFN